MAPVVPAAQVALPVVPCAAVPTGMTNAPVPFMICNVTAELPKTISLLTVAEVAAAW